MHDILPERIAIWHRIEDIARRVLSGYGYAEIRTPLVEVTDLFKRSIGEVTDIVEKEMYSFDDRNGDSLSLRPEGTASCVRAAISMVCWSSRSASGTAGPCFGTSGPSTGVIASSIRSASRPLAWPDRISSLELILLTARLWRTLGLQECPTGNQFARRSGRASGIGSNWSPIWRPCR